jgi:hypothetical protein
MTPDQAVQAKAIELGKLAREGCLARIANPSLDLGACRHSKGQEIAEATRSSRRDRAV